MDNIFVERLWRSLKYEEVYLNAYESVAEAKAGIGAWFSFYNATAAADSRDGYGSAGWRSSSRVQVTLAIREAALGDEGL